MAIIDKIMRSFVCCQKEAHIMRGGRDGAESWMNCQNKAREKERQKKDG